MATLFVAALKKFNWCGATSSFYCNGKQKRLIKADCSNITITFVRRANHNKSKVLVIYSKDLIARLHLSFLSNLSLLYISVDFGAPPGGGGGGAERERREEGSLNLTTEGTC